MSVHAAAFAVVPEWLIDNADVSDRGVRLFAILARHADEHGRAFPGRKRLAARLNCSESSIDRAMDELGKCGAVVTTPRYREDGSRSTNDYWLWPKTPPVEGAVPTGDEGGPVMRDAGTPSPVTTRNESQVNDSQTKESLVDVSDAFDAFWQAWPKERRVGKPSARTAYENAVRKKGAKPAAILAGVERWSAYWTAKGEPEFIPHPTTWLHRQQWDDDTPPPPKQQPGPRAVPPSDRGGASGRVTDL